MKKITSRNKAWSALAAGAFAFIAMGTALFHCGHKDSNDAATPPGDLGATCDKPLALGGRIALPGFPEGADFVTIAGKVDPIPDGGMGLLRSGQGHVIAVRVGDQRVTIPGSENALFIIGATFAGTDLHLLAFSRTGITPAATFAGRTLYDVDKTGWTLELRLLDAQGKVVASKSLPRPGESVMPLDIDTTTDPGTSAVLVQHDTRGIPGGRINGLATSPVAMQILDLTWKDGQLSVEEGPKQVATEADFQRIMADAVTQPTCPVNSCGTILDGLGREISCGECDEGDVCRRNVCYAPLPGGPCVPQATAQACAAGVCGKKNDGCGALVDCGGCGDGMACESGHCVDAAKMVPADVRAAFGGDPVCGCFTDARGAAVTVDCDPGQVCKAGKCTQ